MLTGFFEGLEVHEAGLWMTLSNFTVLTATRCAVLRYAVLCCLAPHRYKVPCVESLPSTVTAFTTALATRDQLARPVPPYAADPAVLLQPGEAVAHPAFASSSSSSSSSRGAGSAAAGEREEDAAVAGKAATAAVVEGQLAAVADSQYALLQLAARGCRNLGTGMLNTAEGEYAGEWVCGGLGTGCVNPVLFFGVV
jgi:hypothetical protein